MANITKVLINGKEVFNVLINGGIWFQKNDSPGGEEEKLARNFSVSLTDDNYNYYSLINDGNYYSTPDCLPYKNSLIATFTFANDEGTIIPDSTISPDSSFGIYDGEVNFQVSTEPNFTDSIGGEQGNLQIHCSGYYDTDTKTQTLIFYIDYCNVALGTPTDSHYFNIGIALYGQGEYEQNGANLKIYFGSATEL